MALTIQERLKDLRVERGLTLEQLAEQTHLSKSALGLSLIHISPAWGAAAGFWVMNLAGTALAYLLTMRRKFLESNLGRE